MSNSILTGLVSKWKSLSLLSKIVWVPLLLWSAFWVWFNLVSGISEIAEHGIASLLFHLVMPTFIIAVLFVCWRWQAIGGMLMIALAGAMFLAFGFRNWDLTLILQAPIIAMGVMLIFGGMTNKSHSNGMVAAA